MENNSETNDSSIAGSIDVNQTNLNFTEIKLAANTNNLEAEKEKREIGLNSMITSNEEEKAVSETEENKNEGISINEESRTVTNANQIEAKEEGNELEDSNRAIKTEVSHGNSIKHFLPSVKNVGSVFLKASKLLHNNALGMLASQYMSGDETDDESKPIIQNVSSDSDSSDSDVEFLKEIRNKIKAPEKNAEDGEEHRNEIPRVKGEMLPEELPPVRDLSDVKVSYKESCPLGLVHSIVDCLVLVSSTFTNIPLDLETILFRNYGKEALGEIFDVLGPVKQPLYCIRFNSKEHIAEKRILVTETIYFAPESHYTKYVVLSNITRMRGSDASWEHDIEPPAHCVDYSDDEEEQAARRMLKNINLQNVPRKK